MRRGFGERGKVERVEGERRMATATYAGGTQIRGKVVHRLTVAVLPPPCRHRISGRGSSVGGWGVIEREEGAEYLGAEFGGARVGGGWSRSSVSWLRKVIAVGNGRWPSY